MQNLNNTSDLLCTRADGTKRFVHDTYHDYFLARSFVDQGQEPSSTLSSTTAIFYAGLCMDPLEFIRNNNLSIDTAAVCYHESEEKDSELEKKLVSRAIHSLHDTATEQLERIKSVYALQVLRSEYFLSSCEPLFMHEERAIRDEAVSIITTYHYEQVKDLFEKWSQDSNWMIRWNVVDCLAHYKNSDAIDRVLQMTVDSEPLVSYKALLGLRQMVSLEEVKNFLPQIKSQLPEREHRFIDSLFLAPATSLHPKKDIDYATLKEKLYAEVEQNPDILNLRVRLFLVLNATEDYDSMHTFLATTKTYYMKERERGMQNQKMNFLAGFMHHFSQLMQCVYIYNELFSRELDKSDKALICQEYAETKIRLTEFLNTMYSLLSKGEEFIYEHISAK